MAVSGFLEKWDSHNATRNFVHKEFEASKNGKHGKATKNALQARGAALAHMTMEGLGLPIIAPIIVLGVAANGIKVVAGALTFKGRWIKEGSSTAGKQVTNLGKMIGNLAIMPVAVAAPELTSGVCHLGRNPAA